MPSITSKYVIYSVCQRPDSPEAFYSTSDVDFGAGTTSIDPDEHIFSDFALKQNYPNPFNPASKIGYKLRKSVFVTLKVFDTAGREVATLVESYQASGEYEVAFNAKNLSSGVYLYRLQAGDFVETRRMVLQR